MAGIYSEKVMDHYKNPRNRGELDDPTVEVSAVNPVCGDCTDIQLKIEDGVITDAKFESLGCAISVASASVMTEHIKGKSLEDAESFTDEDLLKMLGAELTATKKNCATMSVDALKRALRTYEKKRV